MFDKIIYMNDYILQLNSLHFTFYSRSKQIIMKVNTCGLGNKKSHILENPNMFIYINVKEKLKL